MRLLFPTLFAVIASPVLADDGRRVGDVPFEAEALTDLLSGQTVEFFDGSRSRYDAGGVYGYTYTDDGPVWSGLWRTADGSQVCVDFDNGSARCDQLVENGGRLVLIIEDGTRFPVRRLEATVE